MRVKPPSQLEHQRKQTRVRPTKQADRESIVLSQCHDTRHHGCAYEQEAPGEFSSPACSARRASHRPCLLGDEHWKNIPLVLQAVADGVFKAELNELLTRELAEDGYSGVEVRRATTKTEIIIRATRPLKVLGMLRSLCQLHGTCFAGASRLKCRAGPRKLTAAGPKYTLCVYERLGVRISRDVERLVQERSPGASGSSPLSFRNGFSLLMEPLSFMPRRS